MKTLAKTLFVAFVVTFTSISASQAENHQPRQPKQAAAFQSGMYTTSEGKLQIAVDKQPGGTVVVRLTNEAGKEFFVQPIGKRQQKARLRLDVSNLPDGVYQVAITNGVQTTTQAITLATQQPGPTPRFIAVK